MDVAGILVAFLDIINRYREALGLGVPLRHSGKQVGREGSDAALARQVVADERDLFNLRHRFHKFTCSVAHAIDTPLWFWHGPRSLVYARTAFAFNTMAPPASNTGLP